MVVGVEESASDAPRFPGQLAANREILIGRETFALVINPDVLSYVQLLCTGLERNLWDGTGLRIRVAREKKRRLHCRMNEIHVPTAI